MAGGASSILDPSIIASDSGNGVILFALSNGVHGQIVIGDFSPTQDRIEIAHGLNGLVLNVQHDLIAHGSSDGKNGPGLESFDRPHLTTWMTSKPSNSGWPR